MDLDFAYPEARTSPKKGTRVNKVINVLFHIPMTRWEYILFIIMFFICSHRRLK